MQKTFLHFLLSMSFLGFFGRPLVKWFTLCYQTVVCLSVCLVTLVYCGQMVRWIKMPRGAEVGLGPGHIVLDGITAPTTFQPMSIVAKCSPISATAELLLYNYSFLFEVVTGKFPKILTSYVLKGNISWRSDSIVATSCYSSPAECIILCALVWWS